MTDAPQTLDDVRDMLADGSMRRLMINEDLIEQRRMLDVVSPEEIDQQFSFHPEPVQVGSQFFVYSGHEGYWPPQDLTNLEIIADKMQQVTESLGKEFHPVAMVMDVAPSFAVNENAQLLVPTDTLEQPLDEHEVEAIMRHEIAHAIHGDQSRNMNLQRISGNLEQSDIMLTQSEAVLSSSGAMLENLLTPDEFGEVVGRLQTDVEKYHRAVDTVHAAYAQEPSLLGMDAREVAAAMDDPNNPFVGRLDSIPSQTLADLRIPPFAILAAEAGIDFSARARAPLSPTPEDKARFQEISANQSIDFTHSHDKAGELADTVMVAMQHQEFRADRTSALSMSDPMAISEALIGIQEEIGMPDMDSLQHPSNSRRHEQVAGIAAGRYADDMAMSGAMIDEAYDAAVTIVRHQANALGIGDGTQPDALSHLTHITPERVEAGGPGVDYPRVKPAAKTEPEQESELGFMERLQQVTQQLMKESGMENHAPAAPPRSTRPPAVPDAREQGNNQGHQR